MQCVHRYSLTCEGVDVEGVDMEGVVDTEGMVDMEGVVDKERVVDTEGVVDKERVVDTEGVVDVEGVVDMERVVDVERVVDAEGVIDVEGVVEETWWRGEACFEAAASSAGSPCGYIGNIKSRFFTLYFIPCDIRTCRIFLLLVWPGTGQPCAWGST